MDQEKEKKELSPEELDEKLGGKYPDRAQDTLREKMRDMLAKNGPAMTLLYGGPGMKPRRPEGTLKLKLKPKLEPEPDQCEILDVYGGPEYFGAPDEEPDDSWSETESTADPPMTLVYGAPPFEEESETRPVDPFSSEFLVVYGGPPVMPSMSEMMAVYAGPDYFNSGNPGFSIGSTAPITPAEEKTDLPPVEEGEWRCPMCGSVNTGKFCMTCGSVRPKEAEK